MKRKLFLTLCFTVAIPLVATATNESNTYEFVDYVQGRAEQNKFQYVTGEFQFENTTDADLDIQLSLKVPVAVNLVAGESVHEDFALQEAMLTAASETVKLNLDVSQRLIQKKKTDFTLESHSQARVLTYLKGASTEGTAYYNKYDADGKLAGIVARPNQSAIFPANATHVAIETLKED